MRAVSVVEAVTPAAQPAPAARVIVKTSAVATVVGVAPGVVTSTPRDTLSLALYVYVQWLFSVAAGSESGIMALPATATAMAPTVSRLRTTSVS